jgi:hypothetical protein
VVFAQFETFELQVNQPTTARLGARVTRFFLLFFCENIGVFLKNQCNDQIFEKN